MKHFFCGAHNVKLDEKNRLVLPHELRYGLVENGVMQFSLALGMNGCICIYRKSDMEKLVEQFKKLQYSARYQHFLTAFFSTLYTTECDKVGRITLPPLLKKVGKITPDVVIAGVLNKIEIWPKDTYEETISSFITGQSEDVDFAKLSQDAFSEIQPHEDKAVVPILGRNQSS